MITELAFDEINLQNIKLMNIIMGKNGSGKSTLMKQIETRLEAVQSDAESIYLSPERGGQLMFDAGVEQNSESEYLRQSRRINQVANFKQQTVARFRSLNLAVLQRRSDYLRQPDGPVPPEFDEIIEQINGLLDNVKLYHDLTKRFPTIRAETNGPTIEPSNISSGESEVVSLAVEILAFAYNKKTDKKGFIFIDEPDVHLHPDLQVRFMKFLYRIMYEFDLQIFISTHSNALLSAVSSDENTVIVFKKPGDTTFIFENVDEIYKKVLPIFGAHPLSNIFNESPVLLVEGEDDVRIWQQVVRSSENRINLYPVECGSKEQVHTYETRVDSILDGVYDDARAYSLIDSDAITKVESLHDSLRVVKLVFECYAAENLLLADEVLESFALSYQSLGAAIDSWLSDEINKTHSKYAEVMKFKLSNYDRKNFKIKEIRNLITGTFLQTDRPWEVIVGQNIAKLNPETCSRDDHSLYGYMGDKTVATLLK